MSTSYTTIYTSFLSKITDFDLPPLTDDELTAYCKRYMEMAVVKLPTIVSDLSQREILDGDLVTEVEQEDVEPSKPSEPTNLVAEEFEILDTDHNFVLTNMPPVGKSVTIDAKIYVNDLQDIYVHTTRTFKYPAVSPMTMSNIVYNSAWHSAADHSGSHLPSGSVAVTIAPHEDSIGYRFTLSDGLTFNRAVINISWERDEEDQTDDTTEESDNSTYVLYLNEPSYGNFTYIVEELGRAVANNSDFIMYIQIGNFVKLIKFTRGVEMTKECIIYDDFSCDITYDGLSTFIFSNTKPNTLKYLLLYITYTDVNTEADEPVELHPVEISDDAQAAAEDEGIIVNEEVFSADLTSLEIEIIASQMVVEWLNNEINNTQLTRMFVGTKDESMSSQANHIEKLTTLKEKRRADVSMMIRDYAYREWVKEAVQ